MRRRWAGRCARTRARGWRHVVASPRPKHIVDISLIQAIAQSGAVVIAGGGGGIPVVREADGARRGLDAVIDKDLTSALMANVLGVEDMMILTAVPRVAVHFGTPQQRELERVSLSEIKNYHAQGHFPPGSMGPKIGGGDPLSRRGRQAHLHRRPGRCPPGPARRGREPVSTSIKLTSRRPYEPHPLFGINPPLGEG